MHARLGAAGTWGILGVLFLIGEAIYRLTPKVIDLQNCPLSSSHWVALVVWIAVNAYSEGYRGFHKNFAPRVVMRAQHLAANPRPMFVVLAPFYCMGLIHATRKRLIVSWSLTLGLIVLITIVRHIDQPWRGIIDAGVVVGLAIGSVSILYYWLGRRPNVPADVPS